MMERGEMQVNQAMGLGLRDVRLLLLILQKKRHLSNLGIRTHTTSTGTACLR